MIEFQTFPCWGALFFNEEACRCEVLLVWWESNVITVKLKPGLYGSHKLVACGS
jgi:hypothetical protein